MERFLTNWSSRRSYILLATSEAFSSGSVTKLRKSSTQPNTGSAFSSKISPERIKLQLIPLHTSIVLVFVSGQLGKLIHEFGLFHTTGLNETKVWCNIYFSSSVNAWICLLCLSIF